ELAQRRREAGVFRRGIVGMGMSRETQCDTQRQYQAWHTVPVGSERKRNRHGPIHEAMDGVMLPARSPRCRKQCEHALVRLVADFGPEVLMRDRGGCRSILGCRCLNAKVVHCWLRGAR